MGPAYVSPCIDVPCGWKNQNNEACRLDGEETAREFTDLEFWWEIFDDHQLNELESLAIHNNRDLFIACQRVQEARALMGIAASEFYPQITLNPLYTNTGELIQNYVNKNAVTNVSTTPFRAHELYYFLPLNLSYEVDLWGQIRDQYQSAKYDLLAQEKDFQSVMLTLTSHLAFTYYQVRTLDAQLDLLLKVLQTREKAYEINSDRYEGEIVFYADVALAAEEVENVRIQYEEVLRQRKVLENQMAVLIGIPASDFCLHRIPLEGLPPCVPEGLPSEILMRRPDIAEAEYNTRSAHAQVKQAYSLFFPSLILTAAGGFESPVLREFLSWISRYWMLGAGVNQLVFDGLKTPYNLKLQIASFRQASGEYQQKVLVAFQEVEDALTNLNLYAKEYEGALLATKWAETAYQLYVDRYTSGVIDYINVVNTERDFLNFQITVNALQGYRYLATVQLIKALGGGWSAP